MKIHRVGNSDILEVNAKIAKECVLSEFEKYRVVQDRLFESDFDKMFKDLDEKNKF